MVAEAEGRSVAQDPMMPSRDWLPDSPLPKATR